MDEWRNRIGKRLVLSNHNLSYPLAKVNLSIYAAIRQAGGEIEFQTHSPKGLDWNNTVKAAVCLGAHSLEIWNSGYVDIPVNVLKAWSIELKGLEVKLSMSCR